jgi:hypothetical protein
MKFKFNADKSKIILTEATQIEIHQLKIWFIRYAKDYRFMTKFKLGVWDGKIDNYTDGYFRFGLWHEIVKVCKQYDFKLKFPDKNDFPFDNDITYENVDKFAKEYFDGYKQTDGTNFLPYDHQVDSVYRMLKYKFGCIEVATAGGKSLILGLFLFYYLKYINPDAKLLLIVPSISLVQQFNDDLVDYNLGYNKEQKKPFDLRVQEYMSDKPRKVREGEEPNVCIGTYQSLEKYPEQWFSQFDIVVCDECLHPDTLIKMGYGKNKKIKDINIGDLVYTLNEKTNVYEIKEVEYVYKNLTKNVDVYEIEMDNGEKIILTGNHKIYLKCGVWKRVDELNNGDDIVYYNLYENEKNRCCPVCKSNYIFELKKQKGRNIHYRCCNCKHKFKTI